jgi:ribose transport system permease protein
MKAFISKYRKEACLVVVLCMVSFWTIWFSRDVDADGIWESLVNSNFASSRNLTNLSRQLGMYGIFSIGMGLVIISGGIDLSVGSLMALFGVVFFYMLTGTHAWIPSMHWLPALIGLFIFSALIGCLHGFLIAKIKLQPFIITLCGLLGYRGLAQSMTKDTSLGYIDSKTDVSSLEHFLTGDIMGLPSAFVSLIVISIIMHFILHASIYGRYLFALGRNEEATRFSGINTILIMGLAYVICTVFTAISSLYFSFYTSDVVPSMHGNFFELYAIAGAVLGGCSLRGGEGTIIGIILGTAVLLVLQNMVNLLGYDSSFSKVITGLVILGGVLVDRFDLWKMFFRQKTSV